MDRLALMTTFVRAVEAGSFVGASVPLGLTPPMVGRQVKALEDHLGAQLLTRTTRRQSLTEAGRIYYERSKAVLAEIDAADESVALMRSVPRGLLRIDAPVTFGSIKLAPILGAYLDAYPEMRVELTLNNRVVDLVEEGYDAVIRTGDLPDSGLMSRALAPYPLIACAAPSYLERRGQPQNVQDLQKHACLGFHPGAPHDVWTFLDEHGETLRLRVSGPFSSNNGQALRAAALAGAGIILQSRYLLDEDLELGRLVPVLSGLIPKPLPMHLLYATTRSMSPKLRSFLDFLFLHLISRE